MAKEVIATLKNFSLGPRKRAGDRHKCFGGYEDEGEEKVSCMLAEGWECLTSVEEFLPNLSRDEVAYCVSRTVMIRVEGQ